MPMPKHWAWATKASIIYAFPILNMWSSSSSTTAQTSAHSEPQAMISRPVPHARNTPCRTRDLKTFTFAHYIGLRGNLGKPSKAQPGAPRERQLTYNTNSPMSWNHNGLGIEYQQHSPMLQSPFLSIDYRIFEPLVQKRFQKEDLPPSNDKNTAKTQHSLFLALPANLSGQHFSSQRPRLPKLEGGSLNRPRERGSTNQ